MEPVVAIGHSGAAQVAQDTSDGFLAGKGNGFRRVVPLAEVGEARAGLPERNVDPLTHFKVERLREVRDHRFGGRVGGDSWHSNVGQT